MTTKLLLFDIDGTLLLSNGAGGRAMLKAGQRLFGKSFRFDIDTAGKIDRQIFAELAAVNDHLSIAHEHDRFRDTYIEFLRQDLRGDVAYALPGVKTLLSNLEDQIGLTLGLLTGNYSRAALLKLRAAGLMPDGFPVTAFGDEAETRAALVPVAANKYSVLAGGAIKPRDIVVIGDTPRDVACAHDNGCVAVAVATGKFDANILRSTGADLVLEDLTAPSPLLALL